MVTTNLFSHPVFKEGALTANNREVRRFALAKVLRNIDLAASLGAETFVLWGGREGAEHGGGKNVARRARPLRRVAEPVCAYVREQGYAMRFALEPKPNEPRGDILLPDHRPRARADRRARHPRDGRPQPRGRARGDGRAQLRPRHRPGAVARQAVPRRPQRPARPAFDQDLRFGAGNLRGAFWTVDALLGGGTGQRLRRLRALRLQAPARRGDRRVWESARACMRNYLILREKVQAFRADPEVAAALAAAGVGELDVPTAGRGRVARRPPRRASYDVEALGPARLAMEALDQLAMEHLLGVR